MWFKNIKSLIWIAIVILMMGSCTEEIVPDFIPPQLPDPNAPALQWSGAFQGPQGERPRMAQASDTTIIYLAVHADNGLYVERTLDYASLWQDKQFILPSAAAKDPHILALDGGELVLAYSNGYMGGTGIGMFKGSNYGTTWTRGNDIVATSTANLPLGQPFLMAVGNDVYCYYSQSASADIPVNHLMLTISSDKGESWSAPQKVMDENVLDVDGTVKSVSVVQNSDGGYVMVFEGKDMMYWTSRSVLTSKSTDGITWSKPTTVFAHPGESTDSYGAGDPYISKLADGRLITTYQFSDGGGQFGYAISADNGDLWRPGDNLFVGQISRGTMAFVADNKYLFVGISGSKFDLAPMDPNAVRKMPFYIFPRHASNLSVDANWPWEGEGGFAGAQDNNVHFWGHDNMGGASWKTFKLINNKDGYFLLQPISGIPTNKVVTLLLEEDGLNAGTIDNIVLRDQVGSDNQLWDVEEIETGFYQIISKANNYVFTVDGGGTGDATNLIGALYDGHQYQQFQAVSMNADYKPFKHFLKENIDNGWGD